MVVTTELATMNMMQLKYVPKSGIWSEVIGMVADTLSWKTVRDRSTVTPRKCPEHRC
jgi:hypothetical protein